MKVIFKLFVVLAAVLFVLVAVIKIVQRCSWKEAVGILEEIWNQLTESCCSESDIESET